MRNLNDPIVPSTLRDRTAVQIIVIEGRRPASRIQLSAASSPATPDSSTVPLRRPTKPDRLDAKQLHIQPAERRRIAKSIYRFGCESVRSN